jgi:hypothetical protein
MRVNFQKAAFGLMVCFSVYSLAFLWRSTIHLDRGAQALAEWESHLDSARQALPVERGVIGYVTEWDVEGVSYDARDLESEFLLAQYALAPLVLVKGPQTEWNLAVFRPATARAWQAAHAGEFDLIHLNHNVYLLHRRENP